MPLDFFSLSLRRRDVRDILTFTNVQLPWTVDISNRAFVFPNNFLRFVILPSQVQTGLLINQIEKRFSFSPFLRRIILPVPCWGIGWFCLVLAWSRWLNIFLSFASNRFRVPSFIIPVFPCIFVFYPRWCTEHHGESLTNGSLVYHSFPREFINWGLGRVHYLNWFGLTKIVR